MKIEEEYPKFPIRFIGPRLFGAFFFQMHFK